MVKWLLGLKLHIIEVDGFQGRRIREGTYDICDFLSLRSNPHLNTVLHYCCINKNYTTFELILNYLDERSIKAGKRVDIAEVNIRGWTYHHMNPRNITIFK